MNKPQISEIKLNCEQCDIYSPDEGNCRECLTNAIPMKPQVEGDAGAWGSWWYICPVCHDPLDYKQSECGWCHQKIDWTKGCEKE